MKRLAGLAPLARRLAPRAPLALPLLLLAGSALARGGGGHTYSGGSRGGGSPGGGFGGGGDEGGFILLLFELLFRYPQVGIPLLVLLVLVFAASRRATAVGGRFSTRDAEALGRYASASPPPLPAGGFQVAQLRAADPDFSEPLFLDFVAALVARSVAVAGTARLAEVERYLADPRALLPFGAGGWRNVVVGSTQLRAITVAADATRIVADVALGATGPSGGRWWRSAWVFARRAGVRSKGPGEITRLACPACGAGAERNDDATCRYCGQRPAPGQAAWAIAAVMVTRTEARPPVALGGYVEEVGTDRPTVRSATFAEDLRALPARLPGFGWEAAERRFGQVFLALQRAWSERDLAALRPLTTDAVFGTWRYWIEAYRAAGLRNRMEAVQVLRVEPARVTLDRFYAAVTVRIFASAVDRTLDDGGRVVDGQAAPRVFSEYWTFVRTLGDAPPRGVTCSGCGAALPAGQTGQCPYCATLVGAPAFDWILSRIDQDEDYTGA